MKATEESNSNKLIAEFMGWKHIHENWPTTDHFEYPGEYWRSINNFHYHTSWDWLMPVVEKIEAEHYPVQINGNTVIIFKKPWLVVEGNSDSKLSAVYQAVVAFINWHNQKK